MLITIEIFGILTMFIVMFVLIWGFILLNQIFGQLRYKNYLMEKLIHTIYMQGKADIKDTDVKKEDILME